MRRDRGFTLIELVTVLAVLAVLAAVALPAVTAIDAGAKTAATREILDAHAAAIRAFATDVVRAPASLDELLTAPSGLAAPRRWLGPYLTLQGAGASVDAWRNAVRLTVTGADLVELRSAGDDRTFDNADDVVISLSTAPELRAYTTWVVATVDSAIARYNAASSDGRPPLAANVAGAVAQLQAHGLLNAAVDWTRDAYGATLLTQGTPVTHVVPAAAAGSSGSGSGGSGGSGGVPGFGD